MSINSILATSFSGLSTSQAALRVTSTNVANVNVEGYARQVVELESVIAGTRGSGVRVAEIERVADRFLELAVYDAESDSNRFATLRNFHDRLQGLIGRPDSDSTLNARLEEAFRALSEATIDPTDVVRRQAALSDLDRFVGEVQRLALSIDDLRADASNQMVDVVSQINSILERIHKINPLIVKAKLTTGELGPLQEQRAQALAELAELIDIKPIELDHGLLSVTTSTGVVLLDQSIRRLSYDSPGTATPATNFAQIEIETIDPRTGLPRGDISAIDGDIKSGRLRGLLDLRDRDLPVLAENLGELARVFADQLNANHNTNSPVPAPASFEGRNLGLVGGDLLNFSGVSDFAVVDQNGLLQAKVTIDFATLGAGATINDLITAVNGGLGGAGTLAISGGKLSFTAAAGSGVVIADDPAQPSDRAGRGFAHFFGLNDLIETQVPTHFETGFQGSEAHRFTAGQTVNIELRDSFNRIFTSYTLTISGTSVDDLLADLNAVGGLGNFMTFALDANGKLTMTPQSGFEDLSPRIITDTTDRAGTGVTFSDLFGLKHGTRATTARGIVVSPDVADSPAALALAKFDRSAAVGVRAIAIGDNRGAQALADIQLARTQFERAGSLSSFETSLSQYSAFVLGETAVMAQSATRAEEDASALLVDVAQRRDDFAGVNLDEELANMIVFQNAYNAAARMMTTARELYDTLLEIV